MQSCRCNQVTWIRPRLWVRYQLHKTQHNDRDSWCVCVASYNSSGNQRRSLRDNQLDTRLDGRLPAPARQRLDGLFPGVITAAAGRRSGRVVAGGGCGGENLSRLHFGTVPFFSVSDTFHHRLTEQLLRWENKPTIHTPAALSESWQTLFKDPNIDLLQLWFKGIVWFELLAS